MHSLPLWLKSLIAFVPFVWLFIGILGTKLKTHQVTLIGLVFTIVLSLIFWQAEPFVIAASCGEGFIIALIPILWVIVAAVFSYIVGVKTNAIDTLQSFLSVLSPDKGIQAVIIAFGFGGFLESVAGFGTAVAIPTAMLVGIGFDPVRAALISLVTNSVPVAFGALGIPVVVLSQMTELPLSGLTHAIAYQLLPFSLLIPLALVMLANDTLRIPLSTLGEAILLGLIFTTLQTVVALSVGPELVAVIASLGVIGGGILLHFSRIKNKLSSAARAMSSYGILLLLVLVTRLNPPAFLKEFPFVFFLPVGEHAITIEWLTTPGSLLFLATIIGALLQRVKIEVLFSAFQETISKLRFSMITIISIVMLAKIMGNTMMIRDLSLFLAQVSGSLFPFFSPLIGALGTFITGSDTSSNILLGKLQKDTATGLGLDPVWVSAANTSGATAGKMISPQSIAVASSSVGLQGKENQILQKSLFFCMGYVLLLGIFVGVVALR